MPGNLILPNHQLSEFAVHMSGKRNDMPQNAQYLKDEITAALDFLPFESLKLLAEFVSFLRAKTANHLPSKMANTQQKPQHQLEDPILQLGTHPIIEDVTDASINHNKYPKPLEPLEN
jgi:hypothetical protein